MITEVGGQKPEFMATEYPLREVRLLKADQIESGDRHVSRAKRKTPRNI